MAGSASTIETIGAVLLLLWALGMWAAVAVLAVAIRRTVRQWLFRASAAVIFLGVLGQLGHVQEHIAQVVYWVFHSNEPGWMTPLGTGLAEGFGQVDGNTSMLGMEILHFLGNTIFLAGLVGVMLITRRALRTRTRKWARMGTWMQGLHGVEHLALMLTVWLGDPKAIGFSTWFGLLDPGPGLWTYRVWWHFVANVVGSVIFAIALYHLWRERREVEATFRPASPAGGPVEREPALAGR